MSRMQKLFILFILFIFSQNIFAESQGEKLFRENKPAEAAEVLENEILNGIISSNTYNFLGLSYFQTGNYEKSVNAFERGMSARGTNVGVLAFNQGNSFYRMRDYDSAVDSYSKALLDDPKFHGALLNRANSLLMGKQYSKAKDDYVDFLEKCPNDPQRTTIEELIRALTDEIAKEESEQNWEQIEKSMKNNPILAQADTGNEAEWEMIDDALDELEPLDELNEESVVDDYEQLGAGEGSFVSQIDEETEAEMQRLAEQAALEQKMAKEKALAEARAAEEKARAEAEAEKQRLAEEATLEKQKAEEKALAEAEAEKQRLAEQAELERKLEEAEKKLAEAEAEKQRLAEQAELEKKQAEEKARAEAEAEKQRLAEEAALEKQKAEEKALAEAEAEKRRQAEQAELERKLEEAEKQRQAEQAELERKLEEAEKKLAEAEAEKKRQEEQAALDKKLEEERKLKEAEEERKRKAEQAELERKLQEQNRLAEEKRRKEQQAAEEARRKQQMLDNVANSLQNGSSTNMSSGTEDIIDYQFEGELD